MRVPLEWLAEYCDPALDAHDLADRLTMTGTKVEAVHRHGVTALEHFVVGKVVDAGRHPDADRLSVCRVDVGDGEPSEIVCGAPNVAAGQTVAVARPGAVMPDGTTLRRAKLRGVVSDGMILAEDEVGVGPDHAGIMVLADEHRAGTPLVDVLPIATEVLELEVTPNRPDCLGVYGVAREVHAATGAPLGREPWADDPGSPGSVGAADVAVEVPDLCPRFTARVFEDVRIGPSPPWLKARLMAAGLRPISNVVDITNYVMVLTGQPLHAFDLDRVAGQRLVVRAAREGEEIATLDGQVRRLQAGEIVIDDDAGPTSLAGVMGGARSEVAGDTTRVLLEVAAWHAPTIHRTSTRLNLRSEASGRFEKGLSPRQTLEAQAVASRLLVEVCGARLLAGTIDVGGDGDEPPRLRLREREVERLLGRAVPRARQAEILRALRFDVEEAADGLQVGVPHFRRQDVTREADLVEEVARIDGLERLPATLPARRGASGRLTPAQRGRRRAEDVLVGRGLHEIVGWSFTDPGLPDRLRLAADDPLRRAVTLENPMSEDQSVLRTTLLGSLLDAARRNVARGRADVGLFESGAVYLDREPTAADELGHGLGPGGAGRAPRGPRDAVLPVERHLLGGLLVGRLGPRSWAGERPAADVFAAKALVGAVLGTLRVEWSVAPGGPGFLHPARAASLRAGDLPLGWVGELHPLVARTWDLDGPVAGFELDLEAALSRAVAVPRYRDVTSFPAVRQDLAVVVADDVPAARVLEVLRGAAGRELSVAEIFDVYRGAQVGEGRVSLAVHLEFRAADRTLTDEEVGERRTAITEALRREMGAELRG